MPLNKKTSHHSNSTLLSQPHYKHKISNVICIQLSLKNKLLSKATPQQKQQAVKSYQQLILKTSHFNNIIFLNLKQRNMRSSKRLVSRNSHNLIQQKKENKNIYLFN
eukprot:TRINITY_DN12384_c0_g1_i3.p2 TRINITY_DN12384_c0_g1~~TRINITY_DN12384_c0_g1_i3.p2  ORF type:complete len:107 (+),score=3.16 TRINITY_DN12384_c0_g1_i3:286-606(+)